MFKKLIKSVLKDKLGSHKYYKHSSSDKYKKYGHNKQGHSHYGSHHYKKKHSSRSFFSS